jgi:hypothetical protein
MVAAVVSAAAAVALAFVALIKQFLPQAIIKGTARPQPVEQNGACRNAAISF